MAELADEIKTFIVQAHACFRKPSLIVKDVRGEFGVDLTRRAVQYYHPEKNGGQRLGKQWRLLFEATRKSFVEGQVQIGIAQRSYRLELYQRAADFYEEMGNFVLAAEMAERAAKEVGGFYTNRRELTAEGGRPFVPEVITNAILKVYGGGGQ